MLPLPNLRLFPLPLLNLRQNPRLRQSLLPRLSLFPRLHLLPS